MKVNIKYTITDVMQEDSDNWEGAKTPEDVLDQVKQTIKEDPSYVIDGLSDFTITAEILSIEEEVG